ncbi:MAG TPA: manganese efflux pump, partial [Gaiellaceae bacterium]|nr:manganese efflux pump [Gaiellaceae bacterium]
IAFPAFETAMPLVGLGLGRVIAGAVGDAAPYAAAVILAALGLWMVVERDEDDARLRRARGIAFIGIAVAISLDELALGFTIGLLRLPLALALALIAGQALVASQLGFALGARLGATAAALAGRLAGALLIALGIVVFALEA